MTTKATITSTITTRIGRNRLRLRHSSGEPRASWLLFALCSLGLLLISEAAAAQGAASTAHTYTFGQTLLITLRVPESRAANEATIYVNINGERTTGKVVPVKDEVAGYQRDLRAEPLSPFSNITYWWEFRTAKGDLRRTEKTTFRYRDNRFAWQSAEGETIRVHWVSGEGTMMIQALDIARAARADLADALDAPTGEPLDIYIYPSQSDLGSAMRLAGQTWASGVSYPDLNVILIAVPPSSEAVLAMRRDIPHELTHDVLYDLLGPQGYISLPTWLSEGLAVHFEKRPNPAYARAVEEALADGQLMSLRDLCFPFPANHEAALLAYAQSASVVAYLQQTYGWSTVRRLLQTYADSVACNAGAERALGIDLDQLEHNWRVWLVQGEQSQAEISTAEAESQIFVQETGAWFLLLGVLLLPALLVVLAGRP